MKMLMTMLCVFFIFNDSLAKNNQVDKRQKVKTSTKNIKKVGAKKILIKVKGMVCAFCAQGVKKNFNKKKEIKATKVDLDKMEVLLTLKKGKSLSESQLEKTIKEAGFEFVGAKYE